MMTKNAETPITPVLFVGIDVGRAAHLVAFLSRELLERHKRITACPTISIEHSRSGAVQLVRTMQSYAPLSECAVLLERTGHYHRQLSDYLLEQGIAVYAVQVSRRKRRDKTDKRDAQGLALELYNQVGLGAIPDEKGQRLHRIARPTQVASQLAGLVSHRAYLIRAATRCKNKLTALLDQIFPEFTQVFVDPNGESALFLRERYPTAASIAGAALSDLKACCTGRRPGKAALARMIELARMSIGTRDQARLSVLVLQQQQLIEALRMLQSSLDVVEARIAEIIRESREGQILMSLPMIGPQLAAAIIASIGTIANFEDAAALRGYFGWRPKREQTGTTMDRDALTRGGNHLLKQQIYLAVWTAIKLDTEWKDLYERLVPLKCQWDARQGRYIGKNKVIGRIAGQIITLIYHLLRKDYELLASLEPGKPPPPPMLYDRARHAAHRANGCAHED
jgi:transposase